MSTGLDTSDWPDVVESAVPQSKLKNYRKRRLAVDLVCRGETISAAADSAKLRADSLREILERAQTLAPDGRLMGFRACIPYARVATAKLEASNPTSRKGAFVRMLDTHPIAKKWLEEQLTSGGWGSYAQLHHDFLQKLTEEGMTAEEYPLNIIDRGQKAVTRYAQLFKKTTKPLKTSKNKSLDIRLGDNFPLSTVEGDGWEIDAGCELAIYSDDHCDLIQTTKLYLFLLVDKTFDVVLGGHISLRRYYGAEDVCQSLWSACANSLEDVASAAQMRGEACFPSELHPDLQWLAIDELKLDRATAHKALSVLPTVRAGTTTLSFDEPMTPKRRPKIENRFSRISNVFSNQVKQKLFAGKQVRLTYSEISAFIRAGIRDQNCHSGTTIMLGSPMARMIESIEHGEVFRTIPEHLRNQDAFFKLEETVTIRGGGVNNKSNYIQYCGAEYRARNDAMREIKRGSKVHIEINITDLRSVRVFAASGEELFIAHAQERWAIHRHGLSTRKAICRWEKSKTGFNVRGSAVQAYTDGLATKLKDTPKSDDRHKKIAKDLLRIATEAGITVATYHDSTPALPSKTSGKDPKTWGAYGL